MRVVRGAVLWGLGEKINKPGLKKEREKKRTVK